MRNQEQKSLKAEKVRHPLVPAVTLLLVSWLLKLILQVWDFVQRDHILQRVRLVTWIIAGQGVGPMDEAELVDPVFCVPFAAPTHDLGPEDVSEPEEGDGEEEDGRGELVVQPLQPGVHHGRGPGLGLEEGSDPDH